MQDSEASPAAEQPQSVTSTSRSLLLRLKNNESEAWDRLLTLYAPLVFHWCQRHNVAKDDAADVVQDVFQAVAEHIRSFQKSRPEDTFRGWLRVITRNKVMDHFRRAGKTAHAAGGTEAYRFVSELAAPETQDDGDEDRQTQGFLFQRALQIIRDEFQPRTWQAFWRVVVDDCTPAEVADELDMSAGAVRVAKCRVLQRLRLELADPLDA